MKFYFLATLALGVLLVSSCSKKDAVMSEEYTTLTPEQNKQAIEQTGTSVLNQLDGLKNLSALQILIDYAHLADNTGMKSAPIRSFVSPFADIQSNVSAAVQLHTIGSGAQTLADLFNEYKGVYTYNTSTKKWVKTASTTDITYIFPAGGSSTNNASITLNNFSSSTPPYASSTDEFSDVLIKSVTLTIKSQTTTVGTFTMTGEYNSDGLPTKLNENLSFNEGYVITSTFTNTGTAVNFDQSFKKGTSELVSSHFDGKGDFSYNDINTNINSNNEDDVAKIINGGNAWVKIGNIEVIGKVDLKAIMDALPSSINDEDKTAVNNEVYVFNKNASVYAKYIDKDQVIAKGEFYTLPESRNSYYYDSTTKTSKYTTQTYYSPSMRLVFKDGSYMDESYFSTGFDSFINQINNLATSLETNYNR
jgi:hypothetical protein